MRRWRWLTILFIVGLMAALVIGCSKTNDGKNNEGGGPDNGIAVNDPAAENGDSGSPFTLNIVDGKIVPTATFTTIMYENPAFSFREGESLTDNAFTRWAEETLGVKYEVLWTANVSDGSMGTKLQLMLSSGDEIPDIIEIVNLDAANMLIDSGKFMPVEEVIDKYASPTFKQALEELGEHAWLPYIRDGKKMAIPGPSPEDLGSNHNVLWIRQDWLDKLNMQAPTTIEELEALMDAFVNQDPDGNGEKDTYGLEFAIKDQFSGALLGDASWVFGLFGAVPERWYPGEDGKLVYGSVQPGVKQGLAKLKEWMEKGYIASDIALHDMNTLAANVAAGKVGMVVAPPYFSGYPGSLLLANDPTAIYKPYPLPKGIDGNDALRTTYVSYGATLINKDISDEALQAYFHYRNSLFRVYEVEDPLEYFRDFQEGYTYVIKDGEIVMDENEIPGGKININDYVFGSLPVLMSKQKEFTNKVINNEPLTDEEKKLMIATGGTPEPNLIEMLSLEAIGIALEQQHAFVRQHYVGPPTSTMSMRNELLHKMQMETFMKIIYGEDPLDEFDKFVDNWKSSGGDKITQEVNEWWEAVQ